MVVLHDDHSWKLELSYGDHRVEFAWEESFTRDDRSAGYYAKVRSRDSQKALPYDLEWLERAAREAAISFRRVELRRELGYSVDSLDRARKLELIVELFERAERGEYMGQYLNQNLYVEDLAALLELPSRIAFELVQELVDEYRIGLAGHVLITHDLQEAGFRYWEEKTGHRRISMGDSANWYCSACGQSGDEREDPRSVDCIPASRKS